MSIVFYDTETTGINKTFDQILQFAAIKTDSNFNELDRIEIRCRLLPHVVPAPKALKVTRIRATQFTDRSLPSHYEMIRAIREKFIAWSPAVFIGYNSLSFDEYLFRQALYMTLHDPYLTNTRGNNRSDVMRMVQACSIFEPNALIIPRESSGEGIFKLEQVAPANGYIHDRAHDAMGDVEATIYLCRLIAERAPSIWSSFMRFSQKAAVVDYINEEPVFCVSDIAFGKPYSYLATVIGQSTENSNDWYVYDLNVQPESLQSLTDKQLAARLNASPKPLRILKVNRGPMLCEAYEAPQICKGRDCSLEELIRRSEKIRGNVALCERLVAMREVNRKEYPTSPHIEEQIYQGFFEDDDREMMDRFHAVDWGERSRLIEGFRDPRLKVIGKRLIYFERPDILEPVDHEEHRRSFAERLLGRNESVAELSAHKALEEIGRIRVALSGEDSAFWLEHEQYLQQLLREAEESAQ
jgi:exodeoxyribonuclease-1